MKLTVYGKPQCTYCDKAKALLNSKGIEYTYIDLMEDAEALTFIKATGAKSVPQVYNGRVLVGGFEDLSNWLAEVLYHEG